MSSATLALILRTLSLVGSAWVAYRLFQSGLYRRYTILFVFLAFRVAVGPYPFLLDVRSDAYMYMWTTTQPLFWLFYVLTVVELSRLVLERYKGLYSIFRVAVIVSTVVSVTVSALSLIPKIKPTSPQRSKILGLFLVSERGLELS